MVRRLAVRVGGGRGFPGECAVRLAATVLGEARAATTVTNDTGVAEWGCTLEWAVREGELRELDAKGLGLRLEFGDARTGARIGWLVLDLRSA